MSWLWYWSLSGGCKSQGKVGSNKQAAQEFDGEKFNLRKLNELKFRKKYRIELTSRFAAFGNLSDVKDINRAWENSKGYIKTSTKDSPGLHELKQHKTRFDEDCLHFLDQSKQAKLQWLAKVPNLCPF